MDYLKVKIRLDRAAAILAGNTRYGDIIIHINDDELLALSEQERKLLVAMPVEADGTIDLTAVRWPARTVRSTPSYPALTKPDIDSVREVLATIGAAAWLHQQERKEAQEKLEQEWLARQREWLATPLVQHLKTDAYHRRAELVGPGLERYSDNEVDWNGYSQRYKNLPRLPEVEERLAGAHQLVAQTKARLEEQFAETKRHNQERAAREDEEREARDNAKWEALKACLAAHGTENQKKRWERGMLKEDELLALYRDQLFTPLDAFPRYQRLTEADIRQAEAEDNEWDEVVFEVDDDDIELTADEFDTFLAIERVVTAAIPGVVSVKPRRHSGGYKPANKWSVHRMSVMVTAENPVKVSREYACP